MSHVGIFDPALWTVGPLTFSLVQLPPPPRVNKYIVYTYTVCNGGRGYGVLGLRQINTCRKVPLLVNFFMATFCIAFYESYLSTIESLFTDEDALVELSLQSQLFGRRDCTGIWRLCQVVFLLWNIVWILAARWRWLNKIYTHIHDNCWHGHWLSCTNPPKCIVLLLWYKFLSIFLLNPPRN